MVRFFRSGAAGSTIVLSFLLLMLLAVFSVCRAQQTPVSPKTQNADHMLLGLVGYNYTDRHISNYSVNGADGGDVIMSSPTSGGSGVSCCLRLSNKQVGLLRLKVRWQVDGCVYLIKDNSTGKADKVRHYFYREVDANVQRPVGASSKYVETHFYPDGSVKVLLTKNMSSPLLVLDERRPDKSSFPRCKDDEKPEE